ncbi:hypothetical protein F5H01DRAFT_332248 [Linnemannia elongata]|nr:hypothetical protein F5H01DRAFT_332248 [Linnemannia elongata]
MAITPLKGMRVWVAFITFVSLAVTVAFYSFIDFHVRKARRESNYVASMWEYFVWQDYVLIVTSALLFLIYLSSLFINRHVVSSKLLRAFLILIPAAFFLYVHATNIAVNVRIQNDINAFKDSHGLDSNNEKSNWLVCGDPSESAFVFCYLDNSLLLLGIIAGFFVVVEVVMSFVMSPQPSKTVDL